MTKLGIGELLVDESPRFLVSVADVIQSMNEHQT